MDIKFANASELETLRVMIKDVAKLGVEKGVVKAVVERAGSGTGMSQFTAVCKRLINTKNEEVASAALKIHDTLNGDQYKKGMLSIEVYTNTCKEFKKLFSYLRAKKNV